MTLPGTNAATSALATDQYELTMAASYFSQGVTGSAVFDLFVRRLPLERRFLVAAGLADALSYLDQLRFTDSDVEYLRSLGTFNADFLDYLGDFRFTGDVWAIPEGEICFPDEPLLRIEAPIIEAQIVETALLSTVAHQTAIASKAARVALASGERGFVDFASRRAHGPEAAVRGARAAYVAGASATSNVLAGKAYGIPLSGTMAHSYVMAFEDEVDAFRRFARDFPTSAVLLIDTYDTVEGAHRAVQVARELADEGVRLRGVRLDSGDLAALSHKVREVLDEGGLEDVRIIVSGDLDEYRITELLEAGAPCDAFGVGTQMGVSADAPALSAVYKLAEYEGRPVLKMSTGKDSLPGRKQVWRREVDGGFGADVIGLADESLEGRPLLEHVMADGSPVGETRSLADARDRCARALTSLPDSLRSLDVSDPQDEVPTSPRLRALVTEVNALRN
ncbi:nicotinate phosphoribosyltransferase [Demequina flava]|uniref:nicotinate phosphoribosyltransferase n=1 Tax=Demequina flava TaxID=1095025 RepID=UPI0007840DBF|nr:nicotinate phosphoribosyltransferase [Demequina flava]